VHCEIDRYDLRCQALAAAIKLPDKDALQVTTARTPASDYSSLCELPAPFPSLRQLVAVESVALRRTLAAHLRMRASQPAYACSYVLSVQQVSVRLPVGHAARLAAAAGRRAGAG